MSNRMQSSRLLGAIEYGFEVGAAAWHTSTLRRVSASLWQSVMRQQTVERIRLAGWFVLGAAIAHVALVGPRRLLVPWGAGLGWFVVIAMAVACICRPQAIIAAWIRSHIATRGRRWT